MNKYNNNFENQNNNNSQPINSENIFESNNVNNEPQYNNESDNTINQPKAKAKKTNKATIIFGVFCTIVFVTMLALSTTSTVDTSIDAKQALSTQYSTTLSAGTVLLQKDENFEQKDYTITHNSKEKETKILVWDYADEDGDYVQVIVNGTPLSDSFMIKHKPREFTVPCVGEVQVKGIKDGVGGISYAVRYEVNGTNYFNTAPISKCNTYTLIKE